MYYNQIATHSYPTLPWQSLLTDSKNGLKTPRVKTRLVFKNAQKQAPEYLNSYHRTTDCLPPPRHANVYCCPRSLSLSSKPLDFLPQRRYAHRKQHTACQHNLTLLFVSAVIPSSLRYASNAAPLSRFSF